MASRRLSQGLSLLEFTLAVLIVAVLTLMAFERIATVQSEMERAQVRHTVAAMRSALALQFAELAVGGELGRAAEYDGTNALALLSAPPTGYRGERPSALDADIEPGSWYYATGPGVVAYRPRDPAAFAKDDGPVKRLFWRALAGRDSESVAGYARHNGMIVLVRASVHGQPIENENQP